MSTDVTVGPSTTEHMLHARMENTIVLPEGALVSSNVMDEWLISMMKGLGLNLATLPREMMYQLQDGITTELRSRESCVI